MLHTVPTKTVLRAGLFALGLALPLAAPHAVHAAALPVADALRTGETAVPVIPVFGGCGPYGHRGPFGGCRPGGQWGGYVRGRACPPGFRLGPYGRRCWPI